MRAAWITGGGSGIGAAIALKFAEEGHDVAITSRSTEDLASVAALPAARGRIHPFAGDVSDLPKMKQIAREIEEKLGPIEIAVPSAGIYIPFGLADFSVERIEAIYRINVFGAANVIEAVLPGFIERDHGRLAVVTSFSQYRGLGRTPGYGSSKAAMLSICETLRLQTIGTGITVQVIVPGFVQTRMTEGSPFPLPGIISAEEAAELAVEGMKTDTFEILVPPGMVGTVQDARALSPEAYFEMAARTPLFGGSAD